jgi:hypothetical protein
MVRCAVCPATWDTVAESIGHEHFAGGGQPFYCPCGCGQEVGAEEEYASDECEAEAGNVRENVRADETWQSYLDGCASTRSPYDAYDLDCSPIPPLSSGFRPNRWADWMAE